MRCRLEARTTNPWHFNRDDAVIPNRPIVCLSACHRVFTGVQFMNDCIVKHLTNQSKSIFYCAL